MNEEQRVLRIEDIRRRGERFQRELAEELYASQAGLRKASDVSTIYDRYADVFKHETVTLLRTELEATRAAGLDEAAQRMRYLLEHHVTELARCEVRSITDAVLTREAGARLRVGAEETLAFRQAVSEIANTHDRSRRALIEERWLEVIEDLTPLLAERIGIEQGVARSLGYQNVADQWEQLSGISLDALDALMQGFLQRTEDIYREAMGWTVRKHLQMPLEDASRHDLLALVRLEMYDDHFPRREMVETAERFLRDMGLDIRGEGNVEFDLEPREGKIDRPFCMPIEVPSRIVLCLEPTGGRRDWQHFLHELGNALPKAYTSREQPYEFRQLGDPSLGETYSFLFQHLLMDRGWLRRYSKLARSREYLFLVYLEKLLYLRRYAAKLRFEIQLYRGGNGLEGMEDLYEELLRDATKVRYPRQLYLYDLDRNLYVARYIRAWLFEALLSKHLVHYFDEDWYRNPRCGTFLKKQWAMGQRLSVEEMVRDIGYETLSTREIEQQLEKNL